MEEEEKKLREKNETYFSKKIGPTKAESSPSF
jgi:hypothetical protein